MAPFEVGEAERCTKVVRYHLDVRTPLSNEIIQVWWLQRDLELSQNWNKCKWMNWLDLRASWHLQKLTLGCVALRLLDFWGMCNCSCCVSPFNNSAEYRKRTWRYVHFWYKMSWKGDYGLSCKIELLAQRSSAWILRLWTREGKLSDYI